MLLCFGYFFPSPVGISLSPWRGGCRVGRASSIIGPLSGNLILFLRIQSRNWINELGDNNKKYQFCFPLLVLFGLCFFILFGSNKKLRPSAHY